MPFNPCIIFGVVWSKKYISKAAFSSVFPEEDDAVSVDVPHPAVRSKTVIHKRAIQRFFIFSPAFLFSSLYHKLRKKDSLRGNKKNRQNKKIPPKAVQQWKYCCHFTTFFFVYGFIIHNLLK